MVTIPIRRPSVRTLLSTHFVAPPHLPIHSFFSSPLFSHISLPLPPLAHAAALSAMREPLLPPFLPSSSLRPTRSPCLRSRARRWQLSVSGATPFLSALSPRSRDLHASGDGDNDAAPTSMFFRFQRALGFRSRHCCNGSI
ncbi:hypothetical protein SORBI_3006G214900 [Sorghum bicolor]|uniref:Uncharacterized protein n=1 Tax=Sorghum bicolor TaxID=4558 RepID=A0A1B6PN61_SORBI|nr:hypothetical protein SORBI_3006G214900 [Sorghum bicolor]